MILDFGPFKLVYVNLRVLWPTETWVGLLGDSQNKPIKLFIATVKYGARPLSASPLLIPLPDFQSPTWPKNSRRRRLSSLLIFAH